MFAFSVFESKYSEMEWVVKRSGGGEGSGPSGGASTTDGGENCVRLRGLPFEATKQDIVKFFDGKLKTHDAMVLPPFGNKRIT